MNTPKPATAAQMRALESIGAAAFGRANRNADLAAAARDLGFDVQSHRELDSRQVSQLIDHLKVKYHLP